MDGHQRTDVVEWVNAPHAVVSQRRTSARFFPQTLGLAGTLLIQASAIPTLAAEETAGTSISDRGLDERPLSGEWLEYFKETFNADNADETTRRLLITELVKADPVDTNPWSQRTETEIRSAIQHDDLLKNNDWSMVRCSRNGCVAAIDSLDTRAVSRQTTFMGRILTYVTPRLTPSHHPDRTMVQFGQALAWHARMHQQVVFFLFADKSSSKDTSEIPVQPQVISAVISSDVKSAHEAMLASQWAEALDRLETAEAVRNISAFDLKTIYEYRGIANFHLQRYRAAQQAFEKALLLALDFSMEDALSDMRQLFYLSVITKQYLNSIELGRSLVQHDVATAKDMAELSHSYFSIQDCKYAMSWADKSVAASAKAGKLPDGLVLHVKLNCERSDEVAKSAAETD